MTATVSTRAVARSPEQVPALFAGYLSAGDADGLISLYEPTALRLTPQGAEVRGADQLRALCVALCARRERVQATTQTVHTSGDVALTTSTWTACGADGVNRIGRTTQVVRRQPDGRWLLTVDDARGGAA